jgi:hypothetical protein
MVFLPVVTAGYVFWFDDYATQIGALRCHSGKNRYKTWG